MHVLQGSLENSIITESQLWECRKAVRMRAEHETLNEILLWQRTRAGGRRSEYEMRDRAAASQLQEKIKLAKASSNSNVSEAHKLNEFSLNWILKLTDAWGRAEVEFFQPLLLLRCYKLKLSSALWYQALKMKVHSTSDLSSHTNLNFISAFWLFVL